MEKDEDLCILCATYKKEVQSIDYMRPQILEISSVDILNNNITPKACKMCIQNVTLTYNFRRQIIEADTFIRENITKIKIESDTNILRSILERTKNDNKDACVITEYNINCITDFETQPAEEILEKNYVFIKQETLEIKGDCFIEESTPKDEYSPIGWTNPTPENDETFDSNDDEFLFNKILCVKCGKPYSKKYINHHKCMKNQNIELDEDSKELLHQPQYSSGPNNSQETDFSELFCNLCNKNFESSELLENHKQETHNMSKLTCTICGHLYTKKYYKEHMRMHTITTKDCKICGKTLRIESYKHHMMKHKNSGHKFTCEICGKAYEHCNSLRKHELTHGVYQETSDEESDMDISNTSPDIAEEANEVKLNLLPNKSATLYEKQYNLFMEWCNNKKISKYSENVLLAYFSQKAKKYKSSTLWSTYSMLKATLIAKNNVNISKYCKLTAFLKTQNMGFKAKKSKVFVRDEIHRFLLNAPDETYLMNKVCLIFGIAGACRREELRNLTIENVKDNNDMLVIKIPDSQARKSRMFTVTDEICDGVSALEMYRKYILLRPNVNHKAFFLKYQNGKCHKQVVGVHTFGKMPSVIAKYLQLPNSDEYTGHCFRRTSASLLADAGGDILTLKRHGGWKSSTIAKGYVKDSLTNLQSLTRF